MLYLAGVGWGAVLSLRFCVHFPVIAALGGFLLVLVHGLLIAVASLIAGGGSRHVGSVVVAPRL